MNELSKISKGVTGLFTAGRCCTEITEDRYRSFSYPKLLELMRFDVHQYRVPGFGGFMTMQTDTAFGMQLLTCAFMPYEGGRVPFLLIDLMLMKNKRIAFAEYYDCTEEKAPQPLLAEVCEKYKDLPEYVEKPAWYIGERTEYSLIKSLDPQGEPKQLARFVGDSVRAYKKAEMSAAKDPSGLDGLMRFRRRMVDEGNPSSAVLKKVFGEKGAEEFFLNCVMPVK